MDIARAYYKGLNEALEIIPESRYRALAQTALEESAMWANKAITRHSDGSPRRDYLVEPQEECAVAVKPAREVTY